MTIESPIAVEKAIWRRLDAYGGYQPFGWDWRTLDMLYPRMAAVLRQCRRQVYGEVN